MISHGLAREEILLLNAPSRVVISGIGVVSPFGVGRERFWTCVSRGCSATRAITDFDASPFPCRVAAPVPASLSIDDAVALDERAAGRGASRPPGSAPLFTSLAHRRDRGERGVARRRDCGSNEPGAGVLVGSGAGGIDVAERQYAEFFNDGWKRVTPYAIPVSIVGMVSSEISIALGLHGISHVVSTGCTSSTDAIGYAASLIRSRRGGRDPVGRRRRLRHAGDDFRLFEDARGLDALQRHARRGVASVRSRSRRLRARRRRVDGGARARGSRARARRHDLRDGRRLRLDLRRLSPRADGSATASRSCAP